MLRHCPSTSSSIRCNRGAMSNKLSLQDELNGRGMRAHPLFSFVRLGSMPAFVSVSDASCLSKVANCLLPYLTDQPKPLPSAQYLLCLCLSPLRLFGIASSKQSATAIHTTTRNSLRLYKKQSASNLSEVAVRGNITRGGYDTGSPFRISPLSTCPPPPDYSGSCHFRCNRSSRRPQAGNLKLRLPASGVSLRRE